MVHRHALVRAVASLALALMGASCSGSESPGVSPPPAPPGESLVVSITPKRDTLLLGTSKAFTAAVTTTSGAPRSTTVEWSVGNPAVASVANGAVTGIGIGTTTLYARAGSARDSATLVVAAPHLELQVSPSAVSAVLGDTIDFEATLSGAAAASVQNENIRWHVSDSSAAQMVGGSSLATLAAGDIQVTAEVGGVTATANVTVSAAPVASVTIEPSTLSLPAGTREILVAQLRDIRGRRIPQKGVNVTWTSANETIATVNGDGGVTAVAKGGTSIRVSAAGKSASASVNVTATPASTVSLSTPNDSMAAGRTMQAVATPRDANGNPISGRPVAWQSSNPAVATVNGAGLITALVAGQTTISVICDGHVASRKITSVVAAPTTVAIIPGNALLLAGGSATLTGEVRDQFGGVISGASLAWTSTTPSVATVSAAGRVSALTTGASTIRATSGNISGTASVTVQNVPVATVSLAPATASVLAGASVTLVPTAKDAAGNVLLNRPAAFATSNASVATVSALGVVTGVAPGNATVTVTVEGKTATSAIGVTAPAPAPVATVTLTLNASQLNVGQTTHAVARTFDAAGAELFNRVVTFASSNPTIGMVGASGLVTAVSGGSTSISATSEGVSAVASLVVASPVPAPVASVTLSAARTSLAIGDTSQLAVVLRDSVGSVLSGRTITFTTSAAGVASVSAAGTVKALGAGSATITAKSQGVSGTLAFTVSAGPPPPPAPVASVTVTLNSASLNAGQGTQGVATLRDASNNVLTGRSIVWSSSNPGAATVSQSGYVSAVAAGTAVISATSEGQVGSANISVQAVVAIVASVRVTLAASSVTVGASTQATAVAKDSAGNVIAGRPVSWSIASGSTAATLGASTTATVSVTGASAGSASVVATIGGIAGSAPITVTAAPPPPPPPPPPSGNVTLPTLPAMFSVKYPSVSGKTWTVKAGDNLQQILNQAQRGDEIVIAAGATFTGNFTLPAKPGTAANGWILVRSDRASQLPPQGTRVTPSHAGLMPKLITPNVNAALATAHNASGWWVSGIELTVVPTLTNYIQYGLVLMGDGTSKQNSLSLVAQDLVLERVYLHGDPAVSTMRCLGLNSGKTAIMDSYLQDCHAKGFDSQAIGGWNGPGPYKIVNNTLAGAGENVMFGGADPAIPNLITADVEIRGNYIYTPPSWIGKWTKKNLFETKNAMRVLIEGNVFDGSWADGQVGYAFLLKVSNQSGGCTWCATTDITIRNNIIRNAGAGFNLLGREGNSPHPIGQLLTRVLIENNYMEDIDTGVFQGDSKLIQMLNNPHDVTIRGNTLTAPQTVKEFLVVDPRPTATNFDFQNNVVTHGVYGFFSTNLGMGEISLGNVAGVARFKNIAIIGGQKNGYPNAKFYPDLASASATGLGANMSVINSATAGVVIP